MTDSERTTGGEPTPELVIRRVFDAPLDLVWAMWSEREHATKWGPKGFTTPEREMDLRPGGAWHARMISPEGREYRQHGVVREVVPREKLSFTFMWDEDPGEEMLVTVTFTAVGDRTEMVFRQTGFDSAESRDGHEGGWNEAFDELARHMVDTAARRHAPIGQGH
jgi:uncharacterized protein YndB with AHSA1/START domain